MEQICIKTQRVIFSWQLSVICDKISPSRFSGGEHMPQSVQNIVTLFAKEVKRVLGKNMDKVIVYGSYARGDDDEHSDLDIMVLASCPEEDIKPFEYELYDVAFDFFMEYGIEISVIVKNKEHFNYWLGALPFYDNVEREGVVIHG